MTDFPLATVHLSLLDNLTPHRIDSCSTYMPHIQVTGYGESLQLPALTSYINTGVVLQETVRCAECRTMHGKHSNVLLVFLGNSCRARHFFLSLCPSFEYKFGCIQTSFNLDQPPLWIIYTELMNNQLIKATSRHGRRTMLMSNELT